ncbi:hypothetical protein [Nostoc commune]|uniref:hypothetical protein n=1 Tax=Nostoc commune TaxID=1178 RepID=UPI0018C84799|nr:hypothetical protein [Nostoc commune]MBG1260176.1 hypothetical protein [Nostoc commune BAE]
MGNTCELRGVMLEFENVEITNFLNCLSMRRNGLSGWREKVGQKAIAKRSVPPKQKELTLIQHPEIINYGGCL